MASAEILKIGASKEVLESRLKTVLPKIHETFDGQVQVIEESDTDVLDAVMSGELDACFTVRGEEDDAFNRWPLFFEDIMLIYPDSHIPVESQMDLDDVPFLVIPEKSVCKDRMLSWLSDAGQAPIGIEEAGDFLTIIRLVSKARASARCRDRFLPDLLIRQRFRRIRWKNLTVRCVSILWHERESARMRFADFSGSLENKASSVSPEKIKAGRIDLPWGCLGFDVDYEGARGMSRSEILVKQFGKVINANNKRYALAA